MGRFSRLSLLVAGLTLFCIFAGALRAEAWWDEKWQFRKKVVFDTTASGADIKENLNETAVLLRLHTGNFTFGNAREDGSDIRFVSGDDKLPLKFQKEAYDPANEIALFWVKIPRILAGSKQDFIWVYYGNKSAVPAQDPSGVYDVNQVLVYHLDEAEGKPKDETAYGNHPSDFSAEIGLSAMVGNGVSFNGSGDKIVIPRSSSLNFSVGFTFAAWIRMAAAQKDARILSWDDGKQAVIIGIDQTKVYAKTKAADASVETEKIADLPLQSWHYLTVTAEPSKRLTIYIDGIEMTFANLPGSLPEPTADLSIGSSLSGVSSFAGDMDEIQISKIARPATGIRGAFKGQGADNMLAVVMDEEGFTGGGENLSIHLIKVVAKTITLDGWVVIGILASLGTLSAIIFLNKTYNLGQTSRENKAFTSSFKGVEGLAGLYELEDEGFENSSLYKVYSAGCEQLKTVRKAGNVLSRTALNTIRAALDKATMYESRRFGAGLLVLTLCISGGPFLGLLGTVWGVMNTFAGMAEAGEANLMAIAPGVASALACTLAGLLVAIPALFGYSYLTGRIKDLNADMYLFADEFVLKLEGEGEAE